MRYVMVPVPAEHVLDVMRWVLFRAPDEDYETVARDAARVANFMSDADDLTRSVVLRVAEATATDEPLRLSDVASELDKDGQTINAVIRDANAVALGAERPLIEIRFESAIGVHGQTGKVSFLGMRPHLARQIRMSARPNPPAGV
jgi:hypothetical protein